MSVRFLYIARHRAAFRDEVLSELMPPLEPDGTSLLWESLGRQFTGPQLPGGRSPVAGQQGVHPHAVSPGPALRRRCCPPHVQELIGKVGPETRAVEKMLREIGFSYAHRIDPFDGGPHFHARDRRHHAGRARTRARARRRRRRAARAAPGAATVALLVARERARSRRFPWPARTVVSRPKPCHPPGRRATPRRWRLRRRRRATSLRGRARRRDRVPCVSS